MPSPTSTQGQASEDTAARFLTRSGYRLLERNFRCRQGEIDIIAEDRGVLCFIEVRSAHSAYHGDPAETVDLKKQQRIIRAARAYLAKRKISERELRFDVVSIIYAPEPKVRLIRGAFETRLAW